MLKHEKMEIYTRCKIINVCYNASPYLYIKWPPAWYSKQEILANERSLNYFINNLLLYEDSLCTYKFLSVWHCRGRSSGLCSMSNSPVRRLSLLGLTVATLYAERQLALCFGTSYAKAFTIVYRKPVCYIAKDPTNRYRKLFIISNEILRWTFSQLKVLRVPVLYQPAR